jgi:hypothetical protein
MVFGKPGLTFQIPYGDSTFDNAWFRMDQIGIVET